MCIHDVLHALSPMHKWWSNASHGHLSTLLIATYSHFVWLAHFDLRQFKLSLKWFHLTASLHFWRSSAAARHVNNSLKRFEVAKLSYAFFLFFFFYFFSIFDVQWWILFVFHVLSVWCHSCALSVSLSFEKLRCINIYCLSVLTRNYLLSLDDMPSTSMWKRWAANIRARCPCWTSNDKLEKRENTERKTREEKLKKKRA